MKKHILLLIVIGMLFACDKNDNKDNLDVEAILEAEIIGNWKLIETSGSIPNSTKTGADMEWQESYKLNADGTFIKSRIRKGIITEASGIYDFINDTNTPYLELSYNNESDIIGSCISSTEENITFQSKTTFISFWHACDGPRLKYEKTE